MSDLLIKGMDMPKHAIKNGTDDTLYRSCIIVHPDGTAELILDSTFADMFGFEHNLNRFPLVEIPTPHGRLIDADPQNPKKDGALYRCPSCGKLVGEEAYIRYHKQQFCSDCGQRIDWGDGYHYPKGEQDDERKADG